MRACAAGSGASMWAVNGGSRRTEVFTAPARAGPRRERTVEELIKMVAERAGIDQGQAKTAVELVVSQLKDKLPGPIGDQIESALDGGEGGDGGGLLGGLGGALGR